MKMVKIIQETSVLCFIWTVFIAITCTDASPLFDSGTIRIMPGENDIHEIQLNLMFGIKFPFYGSSFEDIFVSKDGMIGFSSNIRFNNVQLGSDNIDVSADKPFVAPFRYRALGMAEKLAGNQPYLGHIYYRTLTFSDDEIRNISNYIRSAVVGAGYFEARLALIATWHNVISTKDASTCPSGNTACPNNTFQAVLLTDGTQSYAIFNYEKMEIQTSSTATQAGFNAGKGRGWAEIMSPGELRRANMNSGSDVVGRYVYKISGDTIERGGCQKSSSVHIPLEFSPKFAGMFGGEILEVSGECLQPNENIKCIFGDGDKTETTMGSAVNTMKARCRVPRLFQRGKVKVSMMRSMDSVARASNFINIVSHNTMPKYVALDFSDTSKGRWDSTAPEMLTLTWNNIYELSNDSDAKVNIILVGYRENVQETVWKNLVTLGENIPMTAQTYTFNPRDFSCIGDLCRQFEVGYVEVVLANEYDACMYRLFSSHLFPLGWFVNKFMVNEYGEKWPEQKCMDWNEADKKNKAWSYRLLNCPCSLQQAIVDVGRFMPDSGCNMFKRTNHSCYYHHQAVHCVRSIQPTSAGAGNQCCYRNDGSLMFAADSYQGSTPDRSHDWGAYPYKSFDRVPSLSHWIHDVVPFYYCCLWTNYSQCDAYMDLRPTKDCTGYRVSRTAMVYGQGHVATLDNSTFRMCAEGDYTLLKGPQFTIQGRFQFSAHGSPHARQSVILTHVAVKAKMETIEIRLRHPDVDRSTKLLDVLVNGIYQNFDEEQLRWQDFKEGTVVNTDQGNPNTQSNFTIILKNGIGIQAADKLNIMFLSVFVPPALKELVEGVLGNWDDDTHNDLLPMYSDTPVAPLIAEDVFQKFQYSWRVPSQDKSIIPHSILVDNSTNLCKYQFNPTTSEHLCMENEDCKLDLRITSDVTAALNTKNATEWLSTMQSYLEPVRSCGLLNVPRSTKSSYNYTLGSKVDITGCRKGSLSGQTSYTCESIGENTQRWSPSVTASCQPPIEDANIGMIVGIIVAVVAVIVIVVIIGCVVIKFRKKGKRDVSKPEEKKYDASYSEVKKHEEQP